ncbi:trimethyllysine dioxygenase, mitochondrial-like [Epargyreus clarus]|uniref:trimethyllysine dioxygenase, mitochondrial-like n=1 Tax=Epargyreus clarus TaxID=520877 RepID=UPI003C2CFEB0
MDKIKAVKIVGRALQVDFKNDKTIVLEDCWLRDHCRCSTCYHADTFQRALHLLNIPDTKIKKFELIKSGIAIEWDDKHISTYSSEFLAQFHYKTWVNSRKLKPILWRGDEVADKITRVHVDKFLNSVEGAKAVFQSLLDYGVAFIEQVGTSMEATEKACQALGGVQHTLFGGMWQVTTKQERADTAYTNLPLAVHNDNTYFTEAAGLQILHCIKHTNGTGGETILADGFYGALRLKEEHPEDFKFLTTFDVEAEYLEDGHHHRYSAPVIQVDKDGDLKQIRFNVYDRSAMAFESGEECRSYYRSLRNLSRYYENPDNQLQFKLTPGTVMVMDNFRLLHGRTAFTGNRVLCGSYVSRSDWLDRARSLGLIQ